MGLKQKLTEKYTNNYLNKYGDRLTQAQGKVMSIKVHEKVVLWIFHKLTVSIVIKPERSKSIIKCYYKKNKWFKKPTFISVSQGHSVVIQGLKGEKGAVDREMLQIMNVINLTNNEQLVPLEADTLKKIQQSPKVKYR
jgi:hypothetical protein